MFPKDSAFKREEQRRQAMEAAAGITPPLRTPEENQRIAASRPSRAFVPVSDLERWANDIDAIGDQWNLEDLANEIRSYLP